MTTLFDPCFGLIVLFSGDKRRVYSAINNVTSFTAVSAVLINGDSDVTSAYCSDNPTFSGNILWSGIIGGQATIPPGNYRYYISGTYSNKTCTWFWDVLVLAKEITNLSESDIPKEKNGYGPGAFIGEIVRFEGDNFVRQVTFPNLTFSAASGALYQFNTDVTATYCNGSPSASGGTLTTHNIGSTSIPAGDYGYFISGTFNNSEAICTWYWKIKVLAKASLV